MDPQHAPRHVPPLARAATPDDVEELVRLRALLFDDEAAGDWTWLPAVRDRLVRGLAGGDVLAAVVDGAGPGLAAAGVGVCTWHLPSPTNPSGRVGQVHSMYTEVPWRRRGLGAAVLRLLLQGFWDRDVRRIELHASRLGRPLYEDLGFAVPERGTAMRLDLRGRPA